MSNFFDEFEGGFGEIFGLEKPKENKEKAKKESKSKEGKKKTSSSGKKKEEKYPVPCELHTEWGSVVISQEGEMTLSEMAEQLPIPCKVVNKDGRFMALVNKIHASVGSEDKITGEVFVGGRVFDVSEASINDVMELIEPSVPECRAASIYKVKEGLYMVRHSEEMIASWNLKVKGSCCVGTIGLEKMVIDANNPDKEYTIKEAITMWAAENEWTKEVETSAILVENKGYQYLILQFSEDKISTDGVMVKLPCNIKFLHDAGPLRSGLTSEMFDGKEYVTDKDILKLVTKYFGDIYQQSNTSVTFVDAVNTVCVMHIGRKKGMTGIDLPLGRLVFEGSSLTYKANGVKIPWCFIDDIVKYFKEKMPEEALVQVLYNSASNEFKLYKPVAKETRVSVSWTDEVLLRQLDPCESVVCEIHSHNSMDAFFSSVDDADEKLPMIYGVIGLLDTKKPRIKLRAGCGGRFCELLVQDVFDWSTQNLVYHQDGYELCVIAKNRSNMLLKRSDGTVIVAVGVHVDLNRNVEWDYGHYYGDIFSVDLHDLKARYFPEERPSYLVIREVLTKKIPVEELGEDLEDSLLEIQNHYNSGDIVLDADNFESVQFFYSKK